MTCSDSARCALCWYGFLVDKRLSDSFKISSEKDHPVFMGTALVFCWRQILMVKIKSFISCANFVYEKLHGFCRVQVFVQTSVFP